MRVHCPGDSESRASASIAASDTGIDTSEYELGVMASREDVGTEDPSEV